MQRIDYPDGTYAEYDGTLSRGGNTAPNRRVEILTRLAEIDNEEIRPLAAITNGTGTTADTDKLATLEAEKSTLRAEFSELESEDAE